MYLKHTALFSLCLSCVRLNGDAHHLQYGKRIENALIDVAHQVSLVECIEECLFRKRCLSVNYWRSLLLCEMNHKTGHSATISDDTRAVFTDVHNWDKGLAGSCADHQCPINMKCVPRPLQNFTCELSDCGPIPPVRNAIEVSPKGMLLIGIGSLRTFQCYPWAYQTKDTHRMICGPDGQWARASESPCDDMTCAADLTSFETLTVDDVPVNVPVISSVGYKWIIIQRRCFDDVSFYRLWSEYKSGFGNFTQRSDFWIGNDVIHQLTNAGYSYLRVEMIKTNEEPLEAEYEHFEVGNEDTQYRLTVSGFKGKYDCMTTKDRTQSDLNGRPFSTKDRDHSISGSCSTSLQSGWWHKSCTCGNVNGLFGASSYDVVRWRCADGWICQLKATRILLRKRD